MAAKINPGYKRAIEAIGQKLGKEHGAVSWLAKQLSISRQSLNYFKQSGFPAAYLPKVSKLTGLPVDDLGSREVIKRMPEYAWSGICKSAPKSLTDLAVDVTRRP